MTTPTVGDHLDHTHVSRPSRQRPVQSLHSERPKRTQAHGRRIARISGALGAAAMLVVLAGCSDETTTLRKGPDWSAVLDSPSASDTKPSTSARSGSEDSTPNPRDGSGSPAPTSPPGKSTAAPKEKPSRKSKVTRLGLLHPPPDQEEVGAPYDPCTVLTWNDFPQQVRPRAPKPRKPSPRAPEPDSTYAIACSWQAQGPTVLSQDSSSGSGMFTAFVVWGRNGEMNPNPPNSTPTTFGPAQGALVPNTSSQGAPMCTGFAALTNGVAAMTILNSKAPQLDTCALVTDLLTRIATKHN